MGGEEEQLSLERRQECRDTSRFGCFGGKFCHIAKIVESVCRETCGLCADPGCTDSFKYGCQAAWCKHDIIADTKCQRTCGTCHQTCQNSFKYGCKEEWCQHEGSPRTSVRRHVGRAGRRRRRRRRGGVREILPFPVQTTLVRQQRMIATLILLVNSNG